MGVNERLVKPVREWLSLNQVVHLIGCPRKVIEELCQTRQIPCELKIPSSVEKGRYFFLVQDLEKIRQRVNEHQERRCEVCGRIIKEVTSDRHKTRRKVCASAECQKARREQNRQLELSLDRFRGWHRKVFERFQGMKPFRAGQWLPFGKAAEVAGCTTNQLRAMERIGLLKTRRPFSKKPWHPGKPKNLLAASQMKVVRSVLEEERIRL